MLEREAEACESPRDEAKPGEMICALCASTHRSKLNV